MIDKTYIPNSYQTPNIVVDRLMQYLLPEEVVVLTYSIRHILGWRDKVAERCGVISLTMFEHGFTTKEGSHFGGCGLSRPKISTALKSLIQYGIMKRADDSGPDGQELTLTFDSPDIDWDGLKARAEERKARNSQRIEKAAAASAEKRRGPDTSTTAVPSTTVVLPADQYDSRTDTSTIVVPIPVRQPYSNKHKETQEQTHLASTQKSSVEAAPAAPAAPAPKAKRAKGVLKTLEELTPMQRTVATEIFSLREGQRASKKTMVLINMVLSELYARFGKEHVTPEQLRAALAWYMARPGAVRPKDGAKVANMVSDYCAQHRPAAASAIVRDPDCAVCGGTGLVLPALGAYEDGDPRANTPIQCPVCAKSARASEAQREAVGP